MKLFKNINFKFLKENIKKSRGLLAFCLGLVPLINILLLVIIAINLNNNIEILDFNSISMITYLGLFIIPIVLAVSFFGFVFKNKSVDFVLSKPLKRSTIYITNIIGGFIIITIFMLINSLIYVLFGLLFSNLIIPFSLILDYFLLFLVSYIFIFVVASLAVTIAGNLMGSIVLILIIICMCPFFRASNIYFYENNPLDTYIKCPNETCKPNNYLCNKTSSCINHLEKNEYEINGSKNYSFVFTAPFYSINNLEEYSFYNSESIIKMLILTVIYTIIGFYTFNKRKMENNETSFKNPKLHYLVKTITLIPVSFLCYLIIKETSELGFIIAIFIIITYSIIYDLITRKEIYKFLKSSAISLAALCIFLGFYGLYDIAMNNNSIIVKDIEEIKFNDLVTIKKDKTYKLTDGNIKGEELINRVIKETLDKDTVNAHSERYLKVKTKNNKEYNVGFYWSFDTDKKLEEIKGLETNNYFKNYNYDKIDYVSSNIKVTKKLKELIKDTMVDTTEYKYNYNTYLLQVSTYRNHNFETFYIMPGLNKELDKYVLNEKNNQALKFLEENENVEFSMDEEFELFNYIVSKNKTKFINYLKNNNTEITNNTLTIYAYGSHGINILIGDKSSFEKELAKYKESLVDDEYYQNLLKSYNTNKDNFEDEEEIEDYEYQY